MLKYISPPVMNVCRRWLLIWMMTAVTARAGDYAADFLHIGVGSRAMAMGGAFVAMAHDPSMAYWNPAGMAMIQRFHLQAEHVPIFSGLAQYNSANLVFSLTPDMAFSLTWIRLGVDEIPRYGALQGSRYERLTQNQYRSTGEAEGYFNDQENALLVSFCRGVIFDLQIGDPFSPILLPVQLSFGVSGKYMYHQLDSAHGAGQGLDGGVLGRFISSTFINGEPTRWIGVGLAGRNLSKTQMVWNTASKHKDTVARTVQVGLAGSYYLAAYQARLTLSVDHEMGEFQASYVGGEVRLFERLALRGGYSHDHLSAGAGLSLLGLTVDYAFVAGELDNTHRVSAGYGF